MNVLLVYAHPEPRSLNGSLRDFWSSGSKPPDTPFRCPTSTRCTGRPRSMRTTPANATPASVSIRARFETRVREGSAEPRHRREQDKLLGPMRVILQFPLWWFSMPAILKGWVERVYAYGFAYGVGEHSDTRWGERYGEGSSRASARC